MPVLGENMIYCENETKENEKDEFICSRCKSIYTGFERVQIEDGEKEYYETELKYCPSCGAKVITDEQENIKNLLKYNRKKSLRDTASEIRISFQELYLIENGKVKPKKETIKKICDYFNVDYQDYL